MEQTASRNNVIFQTARKPNRLIGRSPVSENFLKSNVFDLQAEKDNGYEEGCRRGAISKRKGCSMASTPPWGKIEEKRLRPQSRFSFCFRFPNLSLPSQIPLLPPINPIIQEQRQELQGSQ